MAALRFDQFRAEVLALYAPPLRRKGTADKIRQILTEIAPFCKTVRDLAPPAIARWLADHQDRRPATNHSLLRSLRATANYARSRGYLKVDPFAWRSPAKWLDLGETPPEEVDRHLSAEQVRAVLAQADREAAGGAWQAGRLQALVWVLAWTGVRRAEVLGARTEDVDLAARIFWLRSNPRRRLKTKASGQPLAIAGPLAEVLAVWLPRTGGEWLLPQISLCGPWLTGGPGYRPLDQVRALGERAGVPGLTLLSFRHTFGSLAEGWGFGELELQRWLRHMRPSTQRAYRHADLEAIRTSAGKIRFG